MPRKPPAILFVGVTGPFSFGRFIVDHAHTQRHLFSRLAVLNDTSRPITDAKAAILSHYTDLEIEIVESHGYDSSAPFADFDCVVLLLGNHGLHLQPQIIDLAISAGVRHFYPSEFGADLLVGDNWSQRYYKHKVATRQHLEARGQTIADLTWTYFLVGRFTEWSTIPHFGFDNRHGTARIYGMAGGRQSLIAGRDAARYVVASLTTGLDTRRTLRISGSSPTYGEIVGILERVTGRRYEVTYRDVRSAEVEEAEAKRSGDVNAELAASHKLVQGREGTLLPEPWDNEKFPEVMDLLSVEEALTRSFADPGFRKAYGLASDVGIV